MRMRPRLTDNFVVDRNQPRATFSIAEESTAPVSSIAAVRVATERVAIVDELEVFLAALLVARHRHVVDRFDFFHFTFHVDRSVLVNAGVRFVLDEVNCNEMKKKIVG